jgi:excisionase family DNA binding protein
MLKPNEAAEALGIGTRTLWAMTARGEVPYVQIGRLKRYPVDALRKMIAARQRGGDR